MITVLGSVNLDLVASLDRLPSPGETVGGGRFATAPGGKGANQALAARRAGASVAMVGAVGRDANAAEALSLLAAADVELAGIRKTDEPTGVALILVDRRGENVIAVAPGANFAVTEQDAEEIAFAGGDVLLLQMEVPFGAMLSAARRARAAGAFVMLNLAPFRADGLPLIEHVTHLVMNETECAQCAQALGLDETEPAAQARAIAGQADLTVVVTLGGDGVIAAADGRIVAAEALKVTPVDTVGAGDTFCGYLGAGLAGGASLDVALRLAAAAGSLACTRAGAQPSIPLRSEVEQALRG